MQDDVASRSVIPVGRPLEGGSLAVEELDDEVHAVLALLHPQGLDLHVTQPTLALAFITNSSESGESQMKAARSRL